MLRKHKKLTKKELKRDPLVILAAQAYDYIESEWLKIMVTVAVVVVVVAGSIFWAGSREKGAVNAYDRALIALRDNSPEALDLLSRVSSKYGRYPQGEEALVIMGNEYYQRKEYEKAAESFQTYIKKYKNPLNTFTAYNTLGSIQEANGDFQKAGETYSAYIKANGQSAFLPTMYLNAGKAFYLAGNKEAAKPFFETLNDKFDDSPLRQEASYYLELLNSD